MTNTRTDFPRIRAAALALVTHEQRATHDTTDAATAKALRTTWQRLVMSETGCTLVTARQHVVAALRVRRGELRQMVA